jgi:hypothetical protein
LSIRADNGEDLARDLMRRPKLAFMWMLLLAGALDGRESWNRSVLADELYPGHTQGLANLRGRLRDFSDNVPSQISVMIRVEPDRVHLDLTNSSIDLIRARSLLGELRSYDKLLPDDLLKSAVALLEEGQGEFLPEWDILEAQLMQRRVGATDIIENVRREAESLRIELLLTVGEAFIARGDPSRSIPFFEEANNRRPDLEPVALRFVEALRKTGQPLRAKQVASEYGFPA